MTVLWVAIFLVLASGSTQEHARAPAARGDEVAETLVAALDEARASRGLPPLRRDALLDAVAARRARETADLPEGRRLDAKASIEEAIRAAGRRRFRSAMQYLAYQAGYGDDAAAALRTWRSYAPGWEQATGRVWRDVGGATARAADGMLVITVVLVEPEPPLPPPEALEEAVVAGVNREREARGLAPLALDARLTPAARAHSEDMMARRYFGHVSPDGSHPADRVSAAGIAFRAVAENIFEGGSSDDPAASAVAGWMSSRGHRENILDPAFTLTGVGVAVDADTGRAAFTQIFLRPPEAGEAPAVRR